MGSSNRVDSTSSYRQRCSRRLTRRGSDPHTFLLAPRPDQGRRLRPVLFCDYQPVGGGGLWSFADSKVNLETDKNWAAPRLGFIQLRLNDGSHRVREGINVRLPARDH